MKYIHIFFEFTVKYISTVIPVMNIHTVFKFKCGNVAVFSLFYSGTGRIPIRIRICQRVILMDMRYVA